MSHLPRRVLAMIPSLLGVVVCIFLLTRVLPGDPARTLAGEQADPATVAKIRTQMGLDQPLLAQFVTYLRDLAGGDLGFAWHTGQPVLTDFASRLPATVELAVTAIVISLVGSSMPIFWLALMVIFVFFNKLGWEPAPLGRIGQDVHPPTSITGFYVVDSLLTGDTVALSSSLSHLIWPALCLATGSTAIIARMTRSEMLEVINQDYVRTARSKGLPPAKVVLKHALKNAAPVVVTVVGLQFGMLLGGAVITETVFSWPGVGSYVVQSVLATDYAPVQAFTLLAAVVYLTVNLCVDLVNGRLDPRIEHA